jgi:hypothetical protein
LIAIKTIILLEDASSIHSLINDSNSLSGKKIFISLSPSASYAFNKFKIVYKSLWDYGGGLERSWQGLENFTRIERMVTILDHELAHLHNIPTISPARYSILNLKFLFDVLWNHVHILKTIINTEKPDHIRLYTCSHRISEMELYVFSEDESVYGEILKMPGWRVPCKIIYGKNENFPKIKKDMGKRESFIDIFPRISNQNFLFNLGLIGKRNGFKGIGKALYYYLTLRDRKPVLMYNSGYNWDDSLVELYKNRILPVYRITDEVFKKNPSRIQKFKDEVRRVCNSQESLQEYSNILGIDVSTLFFERLSHIVGSSIEESIISYNTTRHLLQQKKIRCLLHSTRNCALGHCIIQASRDENIPVVSWQHGGAGYSYNPMMPFIEFINSDWHFVFGEDVAENYRMTSQRIGLQKTPIFVSVGSSTLDNYWKTKKAFPPKKETAAIVYVTTYYLRNNFIISPPYDPSHWDETLWFIQKQFMDIAKKFPEREFIIKLHSLHKDKEPLKSYANDNNLENLTIITSERTIMELCDIAEVIIFDMISTGILQVLTSDVPVFAYTGLHEFDEDTVTQLKKRAYVYASPKEFTADIQKYLTDKTLVSGSADSKNREFLLRFGTDLLTHNSAKKASALLSDIISKKMIEIE